MVVVSGSTYDVVSWILFVKFEIIFNNSNSKRLFKLFLPYCYDLVNYGFIFQWKK